MIRTTAPSPLLTAAALVAAFGVGVAVIGTMHHPQPTARQDAASQQRLHETLLEIRQEVADTRTIIADLH
jgi:hypothetical protein